MTRCPQNKTFTKKQLSVHPLEVTRQVIVDDVQNLSEDHLFLYFERAGVEVEDVVFNEVEQSAILTLNDHTGKISFCECACSITVNRQAATKSTLDVQM